MRRALAGLLCWLACASTASAHLGHEVLRAERYLKLDVGAREARLVVSLVLAGDEATRVLRAADADRDFQVSEAEARLYLDAWSAELEDELPISVDGARARVRFVDPYLSPTGAIQRGPVSIEVVAHVPLEGGEHTVSFEDRMEVERFERTDVLLTVTDAEVQASGTGVDPHELVRELSFTSEHPPSSSGVFTMRVTVAGAQDEPRWSPLVPLAIVIAALVLLALALSWARSRGQSVSASSSSANASQVGSREKNAR